jgi:diguanylate cyclase (GGDEF)-like protein
MKLHRIGRFASALLFAGYAVVFVSAVLLVLSLTKNQAQFYHILLNVDLLILPVLLVFTWFHLGVVLCIALSAVSALLTVLISLALSSPVYLIYPVVFAVIGFLLMRYKELRRSRNEELRINTEKLKESFNILISLHEESKGVNKALMKAKQRFLFFKEVAQNLSFTLPQDELLKRIIEYGNLTIGKGDVTQLFLVSRDLVTLELKAFEVMSVEKRPLFTDPSDIFNRSVMKNRQPLIVTDIQKDYRFHIDSGGKSAPEIKSLIISPLITEGKIIGLLRVDSYKEDTFMTNDLRLLSIIANIASTTIKNAMLFRETEELAIKDSLTGLYVKTYFRDELAKQCAVARAGGAPLALLMLDLDNFKSFNDEYGHTAGDMVLKRYADVLDKNISKKCTLARYGGEEFAIIAPGHDEPAAKELAETLRGKIADQMILIRQEKLRGTTSVGVAAFSPRMKNEDEFIHIADSALYEAKRQGRNRVVTAAV